MGEAGRWEAVNWNSPRAPEARSGYDEHSLEKCSVTSRITSDLDLLAENSTARVTIEGELFKRAVYELRSFVWTEKLSEELLFYPADWWEAFKQRWFPRWALRRWPVKFASYTVDVRALYPRLAIKNDAHVIKLAVRKGA